MVDLGIYGYFHFFDDLKGFLDAIHKILGDDDNFDIAIGKYIVLHDQISTRNGKVFGKKGEDTYAFTSVYSEQGNFDKIIEEGTIVKENCINSMDIDRREFDEINNLKKATTLLGYGEFMDYIKKHKLN